MTNVDVTRAGWITRNLEVITTMPAYVDVVVVFGTKDLEPAVLAGQLVKRGQAGYVALTGGKNRALSTNEADAHLAVLLKLGVPSSKIILENKSTNTLENVLYILPKLKATIPAGTVASIVVATKWYHCRRAMMTLKRHFPGKARYFALGYEPPGVSRKNWWETEEGIRRVEKELRNIPRYLEKGDIAEVKSVGGWYV